MGAQFNEALQNLGSTAIQLQTLQDLQNKRAIDAQNATIDQQLKQKELDYQNAVNSRLLAEQGMQATKDQQAADRVNQDTALGSQIIPALGEYAILRGDSDGSGRYTTLNGVPGQAGSYGNVADYTGGFVPQQIAGGDSMTPAQRSAMDDMVNGTTKPLAFDKNGVGLPGAGDRIPNSAFTPLNDQTYGIAPDLANLKADDLRKVGIAGLTPMQETAKLGLAGNNLPTAVNASKFLGTMQSGEDSSDAADQTQQDFELRMGALTEARNSRLAQQRAVAEDKAEAQQDTLAQKYGAMMQHAVTGRMGNLGVQQTKLDSAIHAKQLINQVTDSNGNINASPAIYQELAMSVANMISGSSAAAEGTINSLKSPTAEGKFNEIMQYFVGSPQNATSQALIKQLADITDRQGPLAEKMRDKYVADLRKTADASFPALKKDYRDQFWNINYGNKYSDVGGANNGGSPASSGGSGQATVGSTIGKYKIVGVQ